MVDVQRKYGYVCSQQVVHCCVDCSIILSQFLQFCLQKLFIFFETSDQTCMQILIFVFGIFMPCFAEIFVSSLGFLFKFLTFKSQRMYVCNSFLSFSLNLLPEFSEMIIFLFRLEFGLQTVEDLVEVNPVPVIFLLF